MHFQENKNYHPLSEENIMNKNGYKSKRKINKIGVTDDTLTGRGEKALFVKYLRFTHYYKVFLEVLEKIIRVYRYGTYSSRCFVGYTMVRIGT